MKTKTICTGGSFQENLTQIQSNVFGELVKIASPVLDFHHADLFHDAVWLQDFVKAPTFFFYGVRDTGTSIGTDLDLVSIGNPDVYRVEIISEGGHLEKHLVDIYPVKWVGIRPW